MSILKVSMINIMNTIYNWLGINTFNEKSNKTEANNKTMKNKESKTINKTKENVKQKKKLVL